MSTTNYDSKFCGSLPIHLINLVQPYGVLLVVDRDTLKIVQASENAEQIFLQPVQKVVNTFLQQYLDEDALSLLARRYSSAVEDKIPSVWKIQQRSYLTLIHPKEKVFLIEMDLLEYEDQKQESFVRVYQEIKIAMGLIQGATTIEELADVTAKELKRISRFDKVMVYRFDREWNGTVISEERENSMETYLGITFPASDIPSQTRALYQRNPFRFIPSRDFIPVKLFPVLNPVTHSFLDLSDCNLRSVPAVHIEYLKNMGIESSMSTRILSGDNLWGLIACHHRTPHFITFEMRSIFEMISNVVSARVQSIQGTELHRLENELRQNYNQLAEEVYRAAGLEQALFAGIVDILKLFAAEGAVLVRNGKIRTKGDVPREDEIREFLLWLHARESRSVFATDHLGSHYEQALAFKDTGSGVLAIPIGHTQDDYILLFRGELIREINWGGNPEERIRFDDDLKNYHPRNSFKLWKQRVEGMSAPWLSAELVTAENLRRFIFEFYNLS